MVVAIESQNVKGVVELVPTYRSLMIHYDPLVIGFQSLVDILKDLEQNLENIELPAPEVIEIPTLYGGVWAGY